MTTVGIIGSGMIGGTVARLSVAAGHHVVLSNSRGPETLDELVAELGPLAAAASAEPTAEITAVAEIEAIGESLGELVVPAELTRS